MSRPLTSRPAQLEQTNRNYVKSSSKWIRIQLNWRTLQPNAVGVAVRFVGASEQPRSHHDRARKRLDRQIQLANADGIGVILGPYQSFPSWVHATNLAPPSKHAADQQVPDSFGNGSPWIWFINHLLGRYKKGAAVNADGPTGANPTATPPALGSTRWSSSLSRTSRTTRRPAFRPRSPPACRPPPCPRQPTAGRLPDSGC